MKIKNYFKIVMMIFVFAVSFLVLVNVSQADKFFEDMSIFAGGGEADPRALISLAIQGVLGVIGAVALAFFIYGGAMWMIARGKQEYIQKAKDTLVWSSIGLILIMGSYTAVGYIMEVLPGGEVVDPSAEEPTAPEEVPPEEGEEAPPEDDGVASGAMFLPLDGGSGGPPKGNHSLSYSPATTIWAS